MKQVIVYLLILVTAVAPAALGALVDEAQYTVGDIITITLTNTLEETITFHLPETLRIYLDVFPSTDPFGELVFMDESWGGTVLQPGDSLQIDYDTGAAPDVIGNYDIWVAAGDFLWYDTYELLAVVSDRTESWDSVKALFR